MAIEDYILDPIYREDAINKEAIMQLIKDGVLGTNLVQPVDTDPTYRSGFNYARSIAGGMPFEQVVAPGMSFSPDRPMGYTQQDLNFMSSGPVPVMPSAPTKGEPLVMEDQMPFAPPGTKQPTIFGQEPAQEVVNLFEGIDKESLSDKIAELNLFNFEDLDLTKLPDVAKDEPQKSLFDVALSMPPPPVKDIVSTQTVPVMPPAPVTQPIPMPMPAIPTNLVGLPTFTQPPVVRDPRVNVDDIVSPIRSGRLMRTMPNLFNIV